jgi:hypothetical protein
MCCQANGDQREAMDIPRRADGDLGTMNPEVLAVLSRRDALSCLGAGLRLAQVER